MKRQHIALRIVTICATILASTSSAAISAEPEHARLTKGQTILSSEDKPSGHRWMKAKLLINASPEIVWDTVHEQRKTDPDLAYSKILTQDKNKATLEQKFMLIPVIGTATCVMANEEVPLERIDYWLLSSDRFRAMEGSWVLTPHDRGRATILELGTYVDLGYPVPRPIMDGITSKKLERRLANVRKMAELVQKRRLAQHSS